MKNVLGGIMKKLHVILVCAVVLGVFEPGIVAVPPKPANVGRLKSEYKKFKEAMKCFRQKGWKNCDTAQRKRIVVSGVALTALVVGVIGGGSFVGWRVIQKKKPVEAGKGSSSGSPGEEGSEEKEKSKERVLSEIDRQILSASSNGDVDALKR